MTMDKARKRRTREGASAGGDSYAYAHRTDPWRKDAGESARPRPQVPRADLERYLTEAEGLFASGDPYERQRGYSSAGRLYGELSLHTDDPTWKMAAKLASEMYAVLAARVRWEHGIPTILPKTEAGYLYLGACEHCGRPWQGDLDGACEHCPRLLYGPTPESREQARELPVGKPVDLRDLQTTHDSDEY